MIWIGVKNIKIYNIPSYGGIDYSGRLAHALKRVQRMGIAV